VINIMKDQQQLRDYENDRNDFSAGSYIRHCLEKSNGVAEIHMLKGSPLKIWITQNGVKNSGYSALVCEWKIFDAIYEKALQLGGKMYRGDSAAQNGRKIGSKELPLDTIDAFISVKFYGKQVGDTTLRRSTYYSAIMDWAGICTNHRSDGAGGYIRLTNKLKNIG